jgi:uncharacterized protein YdeI (YjbR/CyaY-like superfamily)
MRERTAVVKTCESTRCPEARRTFDGLSYSNKSWHVLQVTGAKTDETRQRRIAKSLDILKEGGAR